MAATAPLDYRDPGWVAKQLGVDKNAVYRYLDEGRLPGLRLGRKWLISESGLVEFLKREERDQTERRRARGQPVPYARFLRIFGSLVTQRTERVLAVAHEEALARGHNHLGTEHLLLAITKEPRCVAAQILSNLRIDVAAALEPLMASENVAASGELRLTPRARKALEFAIDEARRLRHHYIGTEHLLLGIARAGSGLGFNALESQGLTLEQLRAELKRMLAQPSVER